MGQWSGCGCQSRGAPSKMFGMSAMAIANTQSARNESLWQHTNTATEYDC